ncbi:hypothetical protein MTO96_042892 [Rhipicephalus appendiculatus]
MTTSSASQFFSLSARTVREIMLLPTQAARRTKPLHKCDDMNSSTKDNRAATKPLQILRLFIQYEIAHLSGRHNHHTNETHQERHKECRQKTKQG